MDFWKDHPSKIKVAGHRGLPARVPENTMESFKAAVEAGVDQIETDVRITKDGELVLIHDAKVDRTTNGTGKVADFTLGELKKLDAGAVLSMTGKRYQIPTLDEFLSYADTLPTMTFDFELKEYPEEIPGEMPYEVADRVLDAVERHGLSDRIVINSFSGKLHEYIHEKYGKKFRQHVFYPVSQLKKTTIDPYEYAYCVCMFQTFKERINLPSAAEFAEMRRRYPHIECWAGAAVKTERDVDEIIERKADLVTCNNADEILAFLRKKGYHE